MSNFRANGHGSGSGLYFGYPQQHHGYYDNSMAENGDESDLHRDASQESLSLAPLTEEEMRQLEETVGPDFGRQNSQRRRHPTIVFDSSVDPGLETTKSTRQEFCVDYFVLKEASGQYDTGELVRQEFSFTRLLQTPTPGTSRENHASAVAETQHHQQQHEAMIYTNEWGDLARSDTLDNNPGCVDPRDISLTTATDESVKVEQNAVGHYVVQFPAYQPDENPAVPGPTCTNPCTREWAGEHNFEVKFEKLNSNGKAKSWDYSAQLNKLFIDMNKSIMTSCTVGHSPPDGMVVRILPIYSVAGFVQEPVRRCPNHASANDSTNAKVTPDLYDHLIRVDSDFATYERDPDTKRLSVIVPVGRPQLGATTFDFSMKFMCLGSDVGGINRKPVKVIFTLEHGIGSVVGRSTVDVRICSCPKRDRHQEEARVSKDFADAATKFTRANSSLVFAHPPPEKKTRVDKDVEEMMLLPVSKQDFTFMNKIAESQMIARHTNKVQEIKAQRKRLLIQHNPNSFLHKKPKDS